MARDATSRLYDVDANLTVLDKKIGTITFTAKKGRLVSLDKLHESIWATRLGDRTGMALKVLDVTVTGTATLAGKRMLLRIPGSSDYFELKSHSKGRPKTGQPTYQQLQAALQRGEKTVTVFGQIEGWRGNLTKFLSKVPGRPRRILVKEIKLSK